MSDPDPRPQAQKVGDFARVADARQADPTDDEPDFDKCMEKRGVEIRDGSCEYNTASPTLESCFRPQAGPRSR